MSKMRYKYNVSKAKDLVQKIDDLNKKIEGYQCVIAKLAVEVCEIRHGGKSEGIYTLTNFANDIGIHVKTLQNWVSCYRTVVLPLPKGTYKNDAENWSAARKTERIIKDDKRRARKESGDVGRRSCPIPIKPSTVSQVFIGNRDGKKNGDKVSPWQSEFINRFATVKNLAYLLKVRDLGMIEDNKLLELMEYLDTASDLINDHLTKIRNRKKRIA